MSCFSSENVLYVYVREILTDFGLRWDNLIWAKESPPWAETAVQIDKRDGGWGRKEVFTKQCAVCQDSPAPLHFQLFRNKQLLFSCKGLKLAFLINAGIYEFTNPALKVGWMFQ